MGNMEFSTLPMDLAMVGFSLNKLMSKLLFVRMDRTKILAETAQAIMDNQPEEMEKQYDHMYSDKTINNEWNKLEEIKNEITKNIEENMNLFQSADSALTKAGRKGINFSELQLPDDQLSKIKNSANPDNIYDKLQEYNEVLNDFLFKAVNLCNELSMVLTRI